MKKRRTKDSQTLASELPAAPSENHSQTVPDSHDSHDSSEGASMQPAGSSQASPQQSNNAASINNLINTPANASQASQASQAHSSAHSPNASQAQGQPPQQQPQQQQQQSRQERTTKGKYSQEDFLLQRTLGTGSFGRVHLVQSKHNHRFYAMKVLKKAQVVKMKQIEHTNDERRMLNRVRHPFLVTLWGTWQDSRNLYMVMDFVEGGELFSLLRKSQVSGYFTLDPNPPPLLLYHRGPKFVPPTPRTRLYPYILLTSTLVPFLIYSDSPIQLPNSMPQRSRWLWSICTPIKLFIVT